MTDTIVPWPYPLASPPGPPDPPDMEARVAVVEAAVSEIKDALREIRADMKQMSAEMTQLRVHFGSVEGKMSNLPTTWVMVTVILGSYVTLGGLLLGAIHLLGK